MNISLVVNPNPESCSVNVSGKEVHVITDEERNTFGLNDARLKEAVEKTFGKRPNDVFLCSPTPWGDLYKTYNWKQVKTNMIPFSAEITEMTAQPSIVKTAKFTNNSSDAATYNVAVSETVSNTSTSTWNTGGKFTTSQTIKYGVKVLGIGGGGETSFSFEHSWGEGGSNSQQVTLGSTVGVNVELQPGKGRENVLTATRGVMKARVTYKAHLNGGITANYNPRYKGHHFYCFAVAHVMAQAGISNSITSTEDIEIGYYSDSTIDIRDL